MSACFLPVIYGWARDVFNSALSGMCGDAIRSSCEYTHNTDTAFALAGRPVYSIIFFAQQRKQISDSGYDL